MVDVLGDMRGLPGDRRSVDVQLRHLFRNKHPKITGDAAERIADETDPLRAGDIAMETIRRIVGE